MLPMSHHLGHAGSFPMLAAYHFEKGLQTTVHSKSYNL